MKNKYGVDYTCTDWYVFNKKTDKVVKYCKTRKEAREYAKLKNRRGK